MQSNAEIWDALEKIPLTRDEQWIADTAKLPPISNRTFARPAPDLSPDPVGVAARRCLRRAERLEKARQPARPLEAARAAAGVYEWFEIQKARSA